MPPPPVSAVTTATSPILPPLSTDASRASSASTPHPVPAPPPSTVTSIGSDYVPPSSFAEEAQENPLFGTTAKAPPLFTMPPENMAVPDPAVLAGMPPPPPVLPNFANMSINGMPAPPVAPLTTSDTS